MKPNRRIAQSHAGSQAFLKAELRQVDAVDVNFSNCVQLAGVRLLPDTGGLSLRLHWKALRRPARPWRCFAHVIAGGKQISSLDHQILEDHPPITDWEEGDEGYESCRLWVPDAPDDLKVRLGLYDPEINVRAAVLASMLPVADDSSAVWVDPRQAPGAGYFVRFDPVPLLPCGLVFEHGIELAAYAAERRDELLWLRLKWLARRTGSRRPRVRFFGHLVSEPSPEAPALAQFDQDFVLEDRGPVTAIEQNIVRACPPGKPAWLRAGVCTAGELVRLAILHSSADTDHASRCAYLPVA
jgi:hypothetical protein